MRFVDLFAGLGGFHQALQRLGHECVFASELDTGLASLYKENFGIIPHGDIRNAFQMVPQHDILCAGFPCQPFSKAGEQRGFDCPHSGDLFNYVAKILERNKPRFLILENVPNLIQHNGGKTWLQLKQRLQHLGYEVDCALLSPHMFGIPQLRKRVIIVGVRGGLGDFEWPRSTHNESELDIRSILDEKPADAKPLTPAFVDYLETWQNLFDVLPVDIELPSFPIWAMEFRATYPLRIRSEFDEQLSQMSAYNGSFGAPLKGKSKDSIVAALPPYSRDFHTGFPEWKIQFIERNREFLKTHEQAIEPWVEKIKSFAPSFQKLEWNWKGGPRDLSRCIIQFRASGIRAKKPTVAPSLVALTASQVPVIAWERRYMTMRECARLQSMGELSRLPSAPSSAFKALGNAVNVEVIEKVAQALLDVRLAQVTVIENFAPKAQSDLDTVA